MAETVKATACPECEGVADLRSDKRGKLYIVCPECGRFTYNTLTGQARLKARLARLEAVADAPAEPAAVVYQVPDEDAADEELAQLHGVVHQVQDPEEDEGGDRMAMAALGVGLVIGVVTWWMKHKRQQAA